MKQRRACYKIKGVVKKVSSPSTYLTKAFMSASGIAATAAEAEVLAGDAAGTRSVAVIKTRITGHLKCQFYCPNPDRKTSPAVRPMFLPALTPQLCPTYPDFCSYPDLYSHSASSVHPNLSLDEDSPLHFATY